MKIFVIMILAFVLVFGMAGCKEKQKVTFEQKLISL